MSSPFLRGCCKLMVCLMCSEVRLPFLWPQAHYLTLCASTLPFSKWKKSLHLTGLIDSINHIVWYYTYKCTYKVGLHGRCLINVNNSCALYNYLQTFLSFPTGQGTFFKIFICLAASGLSWGLWGLLLLCTGCFLVVACGLGSWGTQA